MPDFDELPVVVVDLRNMARPDAFAKEPLLFGDARGDGVLPVDDHPGVLERALDHLGQPAGVIALECSVFLDDGEGGYRTFERLLTIIDSGKWTSHISGKCHAFAGTAFLFMAKSSEADYLFGRGDCIFDMITEDGKLSRMGRRAVPEALWEALTACRELELHEIPLEAMLLAPEGWEPANTYRVQGLIGSALASPLPELSPPPASAHELAHRLRDNMQRGIQHFHGLPDGAPSGEWQYYEAMLEQYAECLALLENTPPFENEFPQAYFRRLDKVFARMEKRFARENEGDRKIAMHYIRKEAGDIAGYGCVEPLLHRALRRLGALFSSLPG